MNDDELKKLWQQQPLREPSPSAAHLISAMRKQTSQLRLILDARDLRELTACAFVMIVFACYAFFLHAHQPIARFGDWIVIASMICIASKLIYTRRSTPPAAPGATIVESLRAELNSVRAQSRLLGSVLWWYLLPSLVGSLVMTWGGLPINEPDALVIMIPANIIVTLFFIVVYVFIYRINQGARARQLLPLEAQLESLLHSAETGEPLEETQTGDLRPGALPMAATDEVKPIEFKVSNWQFTVCGDIGIWIFLMDALTIGIPDGMTTEQDPETFVPSGRVEENNQCSIVARKIVDLFNAGDFDGIQKLFNVSMSAAFPPQKLSRFFTDLTSLYGCVEKCDGPIGKGYCGWIAFRLHCQRGELTMSVALDANDNVSGLHFQPTLRDLLNLKLIGPRLFSLLRQVLLMPFFLGRACYSWVMQTLNERAVGISTLGVHLHQGQCLILWDEIKEVRPLKVLRIRSLWLIRESGEKTIMPWTSLERHSDLKAAVEGFAPANHPIRKFMSLLRRT